MVPLKRAYFSKRLIMCYVSKEKNVVAIDTPIFSQKRADLLQGCAPALLEPYFSSTP